MHRERTSALCDREREVRRGNGKCDHGRTRRAQQPPLAASSAPHHESTGMPFSAARLLPSGETGLGARCRADGSKEHVVATKTRRGEQDRRRALTRASRRGSGRTPGPAASACGSARAGCGRTSNGSRCTCRQPGGIENGSGTRMEMADAVGHRAQVGVCARPCDMIKN